MSQQPAPAAPIEAPSPIFWRSLYDRRTEDRELNGKRPAAEARRLAWGEMEWRWHKERGERVSPELCAACRRPIGSAAALSLIDGNRVHDRPDNDCLIRHGNRWRGAATRALTDMGLHRPMAV
jgi:hypothetical protein